ncbi:helix-turn-helix transcriptional regulator [Micromonospora tarapacensis]|uniref:helix-turn-helix transcriptional regulator n=1 Tax=Micromonospora tarapacensis TaxID=2835305 RepID=UPI002F3EF51F
MIDRAGLADFIRRRREQLRPSDVGLPEGTRRRAAGLRREELAMLAGISSDYYARLEQARGANPSEPVVACLARALRLGTDERDHLLRLAGHTPPARRAGRHVRPGLIQLLDRLTDIPALISTDLGDILLQNPLADVALGRRPLATAHRDDHAGNLVWAWFTDPPTRTRFPEEDWERHSIAHVGDLRATLSRRGGDDDVVRLVRDLSESSDEFRAMWARHDVGVRRFDRKRILHPEVGVLDLNCEILLTLEEDLKVLAFFPVEGTDAREKLDLLQVIGTQNLGRPLLP